MTAIFHRLHRRALFLGGSVILIVMMIATVVVTERTPVNVVFAHSMSDRDVLDIVLAYDIDVETVNYGWDDIHGTYRDASTNALELIQNARKHVLESVHDRPSLVRIGLSEIVRTSDFESFARSADLQLKAKQRLQALAKARKIRNVITVHTPVIYSVEGLVARRLLLQLRSDPRVKHILLGHVILGHHAFPAFSPTNPPPVDISETIEKVGALSIGDLYSSTTQAASESD